MESFFNNLFTGIQRAITDLPGRIISGVSSVINFIKTAIIDQVLAVPGKVFAQLTLIRDQIVGALVGLPGKIISLVGSIADQIRPFISDMTRNFTSFVNDAASRITNFVGPILSNLRGFLDTVYNDLKRELGKVAITVSLAINPQIQQVKDTVTQIPVFVQDKIRDLSTTLQPFLAQLDQRVQSLSQFNSQALTNLQRDFGSIDAQIRGAAASFGDLLGPLQNLPGELWKAFTTGISFIYDKTFKPLIDPLLSQAKQIFGDMSRLFKPKSPLDVNEAIAIASAIGSAASLLLVGRWLTADAAKVATAGQVNVLGVEFETMLASFGIVNVAKEFNLAPINFGVMPFVQRGWQKIFQPGYPGVQDLILMVVKEAFVPEFVTPAPELFSNAMLEHGFNKIWSDRYWSAHWRPLEFGTSVDMFHRGIIDRANLLKRFVILDYRPEDATKLTELIFRLPGRVEARIMARFGLLSEAQIDEILKAEGVRADYIPPLRTMMQEFNLTTIFSRQETTAISGYEDGLLNDSELTNLLTQIRRPPGVIEADLKLSKFKRQLEFKRFQIKTITEAMDKSRITIEEGKAELEKLLLDPEMIALVIARSQYRIKILTPKTAKVKDKALTASQILQALKKGTIPPQDAYDALLVQYTDPKEVEILINTALATLKP